MKNQYIIIAIVALAVGAAAFYGGMQYQKTKIPTFRMNFRNGNGAPGPNQGNRVMNRFQIGDIVKADDQSITVTYPDGSSKIIILSSTTAINKSSAGSKSDLQAGTKVMVMSTPNPDGSETAHNIQINPPSRPN